MKTSKQRLDQLLVARNLAESRQKARGLVLAGQVLVDGQRIEKVGQSVAEDSRIEVLQPPPFVSRAGPKLAAALDAFHIEVAGKTCLDVGASTGGFTSTTISPGLAMSAATGGRTSVAEMKLTSQTARFTGSPMSSKRR